MDRRPYLDFSIEQLLKLKEENKSYGAIVADINAEIRQKETEANIKTMQENIAKLTVPHWSFTPTFWLVLVTTILTLISTAILIFQFWQSYSQGQKSGSNTLPAPIHLESSAPTVVQPKLVSQPSPSQGMKKNAVVTKKLDAKSK